MQNKIQKAAIKKKVRENFTVPSWKASDVMLISQDLKIKSIAFAFLSVLGNKKIAEDFPEKTTENIFNAFTFYLNLISPQKRELRIFGYK